MTRKDYVKLADAFRNAKVELLEIWVNDDGPQLRNQLIGLKTALSHVSQALARDNPDYNAEKFYNAIGLE